jgi:type I restriction enzyme S subunit
VKADWKLERLGDVCALENGDRGSNYPSKSIRTSEGVPFINAGHLTEAGINPSTLDFIPRNRFELLGSGKIKPGDYLFCLRGSLGKASGVGDLREGAIASSLVIVRPSPRILGGYLLAYFRSDYCAQMIAMYKNGAAQPNLSSNSLSSFSVPLPPLPEQQRIVAILDEAFAAIATAKAKAEKNLQNAVDLFSSQLHEVYTQSADWSRPIDLASLCQSTRSICYGVIKLGDDDADGVPCLRTSNVRWLNIETTTVKKIAPSISDEYSRTVLKGGEVLVNVRGTLGGVAVVPPEMATWNISREVALVPIDPTVVLPEFLASWIAAGVSQEWLGSVKKGAAYVGINIEDLRRLPVRVPSRDQQQEVVNELNDFRAETLRLESLYHRKLAALDELKKSLLHRAFNGDL